MRNSHLPLCCDLGHTLDRYFDTDVSEVKYNLHVKLYSKVVSYNQKIIRRVAFVVVA